MNLLVFTVFLWDGARIWQWDFGVDPCESGASELGVWGRSRVGDRRVF